MEDKATPAALALGAVAFGVFAASATAMACGPRGRAVAGRAAGFVLDDPVARTLLFLAALATIWAHHSAGVPWSLRLAERDWTVICCDPERAGVSADGFALVRVKGGQMARVLAALPEHPAVHTLRWAQDTHVPPTELREVLYDALWRAKTIRHVGFYGARFLDSHALRALLAGDSQLETLELGNCALGAPAWESIVAALEGGDAPRLAELRVAEVPEVARAMALRHAERDRFAERARAARPGLLVSVTTDDGEPLGEAVGEVEAARAAEAAGVAKEAEAEKEKEKEWVTEL